MIRRGESVYPERSRRATHPFTLRREVPRDKASRARISIQPEKSPSETSRNLTGLSLADHSRRRNLRNFLFRLFLFALPFVFASHAQHHATTSCIFEILLVVPIQRRSSLCDCFPTK